MDLAEIRLWWCFSHSVFRLVLSHDELRLKMDSEIPNAVEACTAEASCE